MVMLTKITHLTLFVSNQDEALRFYTEKLGFKVHTDHMLGSFRWLTLNLPGQKDVELVLMLGETPEEKALVGKQGGSKPFLSLETDNLKKDYDELTKRGVHFVDTPKEEPWGMSATLKDLYGNMLYLCQPPAM